MRGVVHVLPRQGSLAILQSPIFCASLACGLCADSRAGAVLTNNPAFFSPSHPSRAPVDLPPQTSPRPAPGARTSTASGESAQSAGGKPAKSAGSSAGSKPAKSSGGVKSAKERVSWSDASEDSELCWFLCVFGPTVGLSETYSFFLQLRCVVGLRWSHCISSSPHLQPS